MIEDAMRSWSDVDDVADLVDTLLADLRSRDLPPAVAQTVEVATRAFVTADGHHEDAVRQVGPALMRLGRRAAVRGHSASRLSRDLRAVVAEREHAAELMLARVRRPEEREAIRQRLEQFFRQVHLAALRGHHQVLALQALGEEERRSRVVRALFGEPVPAELLAIAGIDPDVPLTPVALVDGVLEAAPAGAIAAPDGRVLLLPPPAEPGPGSGTSRWVVGPARPPTDLADAVSLTRQAATALRAGLLDVDPDARVISCADVADQLLVAGRPALTALLVDKHLTGLLELRVTRRVELAEVLLTWLETRGSLADVAARHHIARQTAFDRLRQGKALLGEAVEEPGAHASLVVALNASLPEWRAEAAVLEAERRARAGARNRCASALTSLPSTRRPDDSDVGHTPIRSIAAPAPSPTSQEIR